MTKKITIKLGGSCLGSPVEATKHFAQVRNIVQMYLEQGIFPVIVVSALAGETRRLKRMADDLFTQQKDKDALLAQGEFFSSQAVASYLASQNIPAKALWGDALPVYADGVYGNANITHVDVLAIDAIIANGIIPVIPGFLGKTEEGTVCTLGFDGSDTSAVGIAAALGTSCVLYKDVDGVYTAHPGHVHRARRLQHLAYGDMWHYACAGAAVVHPRAVKTAWDQNVPVRVASFTKPESAGTLIDGDAAPKAIVGVIQKQQDITVVKTPDALFEIPVGLSVLKQNEHGLVFNLNEEAPLAEVLNALHHAAGLDS